MAQAIAVARGYLGRSNVECMRFDETILVEAFDLMERHGLGRKRIADTIFAATLLHHGVEELITCNLDDYQIFEGLKLIDPRKPRKPQDQPPAPSPEDGVAGA